ncbi:cytochrome c oxidase assembly protein [Planococcus salinus]|uniref:Cytochrome c oxidase assembly protein n=2 Tax=Planococcus salinus TaxID=1848460 RepID=A0A3M8P9G6_9BACL|nr:cytochrome c oxidase assembly protein [Planococcus salinus]
MNGHIQTTGTSFETIAGGIGIAAVLLYFVMAALTGKKFRKWPVHRYFLWSIGVLCAAAAVTGPLAALAHTNFKVHMMGHLLLGMLAPLLMVFGKPMTLLLRSLSTRYARLLTRLFKSRPIRLLSNPLTAATLNIGGLYLLYMTDLYMMTHQSLFLYALVHVHVFLAGYLFTISIIYIDISPHRFSYIYRSVVMILALAGHKILSKYIYANPPSGVSKPEAEAGGMLMYYGGDLIDLALITIFCYQWYKDATPRAFPSMENTD